MECRVDMHQSEELPDIDVNEDVLEELREGKHRSSCRRGNDRSASMISKTVNDWEIKH